MDGRIYTFRCMVKASLKKLHLNGNVNERSQPRKPTATPSQPGVTASAKCPKRSLFPKEEKGWRVEGTGRRQMEAQRQAGVVPEVNTELHGALRPG